MIAEKDKPTTLREYWPVLQIMERLATKTPIELNSMWRAHCTECYKTIACSIAKTLEDSEEIELPQQWSFTDAPLAEQIILRLLDMPSHVACNFLEIVFLASTASLGSLTGMPRGVLLLSMLQSRDYLTKDFFARTHV